MNSKRQRISVKRITDEKSFALGTNYILANGKNWLLRHHLLFVSKVFFRKALKNDI